jgi:hypothetical protein
MSSDMDTRHGTTPMPENPKKRFTGEYIGIVESIFDPKNLMRVQVRVKGVFTDDVEAADLPWATYKLPIGFRPNDGMFTPVDVEDYVWVDFPFDNDTRRPRITGSVHFCPGEAPNFPDDAWEGPGAVIPARTPDQPEAGDQPEYHTACIYKQHGISAEIRPDGTLRITQAASGTNVEIAADGSVLVHAEGNLYLSTENDELAEVAHDATKTIGNNESVEIGNDATKSIGNNRTLDVGNNESVGIQGDSDKTVMGDMTENVMGSLVSEANGDQQISGQRAVYIRSAGKVIIEAPSVEIN